MSESKAQIHQYLTKDASEETPAEELETTPFDWDLQPNKPGVPVILDVKTGYMEAPGSDWTNDQIARWLQSKNWSGTDIESYIRGWRQLDKKA